MVSPDAWLAIVNPASGRPVPAQAGATSRHRSGCRRARSRWCGRSGPTTARRSRGGRVQDGARRLIAAGGDGSVNDVLNGDHGGWPPRHPGVTLAVAPTGTGNDWARSLGIGRRPVRWRRRSSAAGRCSTTSAWWSTPGTPARTAPLVHQRRGRGIRRHMTARVPRAGTVGAHLPEGRAEWACWLPRPAIPGRRRRRDDIRRPDAAGVRRQRPVLRQPHGRRARSPAWTTACSTSSWCASSGSLAVLPKLAKLYRGTILGDPAVRHLRAATVRVEAEPPAAIQADGQMVGGTPAEFSVLRRALEVVTGNTFPPPSSVIRLRLPQSSGNSNLRHLPDTPARGQCQPIRKAPSWRARRIRRWNSPPSYCSVRSPCGSSPRQVGLCTCSASVDRCVMRS